MEELIPCKILAPIKVGEMIIGPCPSFDLPQSVALEQQRKGRVEIGAGAEAFTPTEPQDGVVEVEQSNTTQSAPEAAAQKPSTRTRKAK